MRILHKSLKSKMKKNIVLTVLFSAAAAFSFSQTTTEETIPHYNHAVGAAAGFTTVYGLSYRYTPTKFGFQVTFAPYKSAGVSRYSMGLTLLYTIIETKNTNLFLYQGNHYFYHSWTEYIDTATQIVYYPKPNFTTTIEKKNVDSYFNCGIGIGIEFIIAKRIGFSLMGGYAFYDNFRNVNFTGETALYFKFWT